MAAVNESQGERSFDAEHTPIACSIDARQMTRCAIDSMALYSIGIPLIDKQLHLQSVQLHRRLHRTSSCVFACVCVGRICRVVRLINERQRISLYDFSSLPTIMVVHAPSVIEE